MAFRADRPCGCNDRRSDNVRSLASLPEEHGVLAASKLAGFKLIPAVTYSQNQVAPNELWAEIEIRLDIYLNCTGALVWCDPEALVRTFQWAPTPLP